ncbi:DUF4178 domain-containing protein [Flavobacterium sp. SUN046]|uniref:DUF4178 domain-containing protein n=1 Tax=Flavobacterium sp. SUN046 TaxID=3002440 RepID=UPI002DBF71A0|nr:DUF4178 domain-containing protein [Flavobacterium sp. SUN046]MEC4051013.1 DUF4178 domain-containing protein [Flavobacterium sp. SUN046]
MDISCFHCNTVTSQEICFVPTEFVCPSCQAQYKSERGELKYTGKFNSTYTFTLSVGQKGQFKGTEYTVSGILIKKAFGSYEWAEYILQDTAGNFLYLSEASGHWILLEEVAFDEKVGNHPRTVDYDIYSLNLYEYYDADVVGAKGFFDFDIEQKTELIEYIHPPFILSVEKTNEGQTAFYGKHISKREVKKAFGISEVPYASGVGVVQPFPFNFVNTIISFCAFAIIMVFANWFLNKDRVQYDVLDLAVPYGLQDGKDYTTPSFELKGSAAPMTIKAFSEVDNSWANIDVALVNEKTNEEIYANKDIEYYHGYTDGENWTEGSTSEDFNICGVSEGKYHLVLTPSKAPEDVKNNYIRVQASWNEPTTHNLYMTYLFMGIFIVIVFFANRYFETQRWQDSSYSPYNQE